LAFRGLGAQAATSGAIWDHVVSQGVSATLGYRLIGECTISPRGVPLRHVDYRLEAPDWRAPYPIQIEGLEQALPLFGV
jgi:hypothetical protein